MPRSSNRLLLLPLVFVFVACGDAGSGGTRYGWARAGLEARIEGDEGISVVVPAGAVDEDVRIGLTPLPRTRRPDPAVAVVVGPGVRLSPAGKEFERGVQITIPIVASDLPSGKTLDDVVVMRASRAGEDFVPLPTRRSGGVVVAQTEHFSDFVVVVSTGAAPLPCVDAMCLPTESCTSCPIDCGLCLAPGTCGNGLCESSESCGSCDADCLCSGDGGTAPPLTYVDPETNLEWIRIVEDSTITQVDAVAYCDGLSTDGRSDWRLPTRDEETTRLDYSLGGTTHDASLFTIPAGNRRWTATPVAGATGSVVWTIETTGRMFSETTGVLRNAGCVRSAGIRPGRSFSVDGELVTDSRSGLVWQRSPGPLGSHADAGTYCAALSLGTLTSGWRVPTADELLAIVDDSRSNPAIDTDSFVSIGGRAWTTSSYSTSGFVWTVDFSTGVIDGANPVIADVHVRCVH